MEVGLIMLIYRAVSNMIVKLIQILSIYGSLYYIHVVSWKNIEPVTFTLNINRFK